VTEPENEFGEFGEERLIEMVERHRHLPLAAISQQVLQALRAWIGEQEQPDDITLVLARQAGNRKNGDGSKPQVEISSLG
jgi:phosphoserine phosphatase RsbU/P